ncbi:MAG: hypothetical protein GY931_11500 [Maribacter sp.]|nr:hypothetical protein [Maribacter sp.]
MTKALAIIALIVFITIFYLGCWKAVDLIFLRPPIECSNTDCEWTKEELEASDTFNDVYLTE